MKYKSFIIAAIVAVISHASAATYTINNGATTTASGIAASDGSIYRGTSGVGTALGGTNGGISAGPGVIGMGIFSTEAFAPNSSLASIVSAFTLFGNTGTFSAAGPTSTRGVFSIGEPAVTIAGNATFLDKNMYLLVGNGTTFANSTELLVLKNSRTFAAADDGVVTGITFSFTTGNSTVLFGTALPNVYTTGSDTSLTPGWATAAPVPEPSAALLGLLGIAGLIRRRR